MMCSCSRTGRSRGVWRFGLAVALFGVLVSCTPREGASPQGVVGTWRAAGPAEGSKGFGPPSKVIFRPDGKCVLDWGKQGRYKLLDGDHFEVTVYEFASTLVTTGKYLRDADAVEVFENRYERVADEP